MDVVVRLAGESVVCIVICASRVRVTQVGESTLRVSGRRLGTALSPGGHISIVCHTSIKGSMHRHKHLSTLLVSHDHA